MKNQLQYFIILVLGLTMFQGQAQDQQDFINPPNEAKPRVWWHWMNGNITKEGIQKDLDWMKQTGIGGFQNFDANLFTPVVVPNKLVFMTSEWKDAFKFTTELAVKNELEMAIAGSPGWSVTGGPWVAPKDGMKKYVWSEVSVNGGQIFDGPLPEPAHTTGEFQNVAIANEGLAGNGLETLPEYYEDAAVVAFKLSEKEITLTELNPKVTSSAGSFALDQLTDGDLAKGAFLPPSEVGENMWIQYEFSTPQTFRSYAVTGAYHSTMEQFRGSPNNRAMLVSDDGINFKKITDIPGTLVPQTTGSFPITEAKFWRFVIETLPPSPAGIAALFGAPTPTEPDGIEVAEFNLYTQDRLDRYEQKAGFAAWQEQGLPNSKDENNGVDAANVIDLTEKFDTNGHLKWQVPEGNWKIIRLGYSLTGRQNHPASPEATGLEVDKLDKDAVRRYINTYLDMYKDATGGLMGAEGLGFMILDSYEAGHMNWTHNMLTEFSNRRGYDMKPWLPVLAGYIVNDVSQSEKFLWDFRKTIGEMIVENHYDIIGEELHKRGMMRYTESHENGRIFLADGMDVKRKADIPMSAMWTPGSLAGGSDEEVRSEADIREAASVANIYGKPFVAAESMTSIMNAFSWHPEKLKRTADLELASGLNRFVIHTSVHQPLDKGPGFSLGPFGQYFTRLETWSDAGAKAWIAYLGRSSYLLQQGQNIADVLYYYGENTNITLVSRERLPEIPQGLEFDYVNASILKEDIKAEEGKLITPSGTSYKVLMLDESAKEMTLSVLKKISELQSAGVAVVGTKPESSPSLADDAEEYRNLAEKVSSKMTGMEILGLKPDIETSGTDHKILFRHRRDNETDIYWLNNRSDEPATATISFNVTGKIPKLWNAENGKISALGYEIKNGRTVVPINFKSWDAIFVIFQEQATQEKHSLSKPVKESEQILSGKWTLALGDKSKELNELQSWTDSEDTKYFSGTAVYTYTFTQKKKVKAGETYLLQFKDIKNIAEVALNNETLGTIWKKPYEIDITSALQKGTNELKVKVTNTWVNRLIGDAQADEKDKTTFTTMSFYNADATLLPSGLIGEVKVVQLK